MLLLLDCIMTSDCEPWRITITRQEEGGMVTASWSCSKKTFQLAYVKRREWSCSWESAQDGLLISACHQSSLGMPRLGVPLALVSNSVHPSLHHNHPKVFLLPLWITWPLFSPRLIPLAPSDHQLQRYVYIKVLQSLFSRNTFICEALQSLSVIS